MIIHLSQVTPVCPLGAGTKTLWSQVGHLQAMGYIFAREDPMQLLLKISSVLVLLSKSQSVPRVGGDGAQSLILEKNQELRSMKRYFHAA